MQNQSSKQSRSNAPKGGEFWRRVEREFRDMGYSRREAMKAVKAMKRNRVEKLER